MNFKLFMKQNYPTMLTIGGIVLGAASIVFTAVQTKKVIPIVEKNKKELEEIKTLPTASKEEEKTKTKKTVVAVAKHGLDYAKVYALPASLAVGSAASILFAHHIMKGRVAALSASCASLLAGFNEYRQRVREKYGEEVDKELRYGNKTKEVEETVVDEKTGEVKTVKKTVPNGRSIYAVCFDEKSRAWEKDALSNRLFVSGLESFSNDRLRANGYLFLNDVYEALGLPKTLPGQCVGWRYDPKDQSHGNNYISFALVDGKRYHDNYEFLHDPERSFWLDFNVDGPIIDDFEKYSKEF